MESEINKAQHGMKLPALSEKISDKLIKTETGEIYVSSYQDGELTLPVITENMARIKAAFPSLPQSFYAILAERIKAKSFTDNQLKDAVSNVIDNCIYPQPTIANFLSFEKKIRLFTYSEMCAKVHEKGQTIWDLHDKKKIDGVTYWYSKTELI